jgi:uncharacterized protein (TIGR00251 family)
VTEAGEGRPPDGPSPVPRAITPTATGILIEVRVVPRAGRSGIAGTRGDALLVRLSAAPVEGAANGELIEVLARALGVPKRSVAIESGERSKQKRVRVEGLSEREAIAALTLSIDGPRRR